MRLGGRAQAAIEILNALSEQHRPIAHHLAEWGRAHRFAGGGDRAAIGNLVYDTLRRKASTAHAMDSDKSRKLVLGTLMRHWNETPESLAAAFKDDRHAPEPPAEQERLRPLDEAPGHVQADIPEWCQPSFEANFDTEWIAEGQALAQRPPLDMRVNTLKADRPKVAKSLRSNPGNSGIALHGLRVEAGEAASRLPNVTADAAYQKGWFEVQDEGSQIVSSLVYARPGEQVLDFCAGAGGKTLALAATMENKGQLHAYDSDRNRLKPIHERIRRAGTRNVQVHSPDDDMSALVGKMDRVLVDAPCTGSGTWRRRPDSKWKLTAEQLADRLREQEEVLAQAAPFVRPGGFMAYVTCSVFPEENENQTYAFIQDNPEWELLSAGEVWQDLFGFDKPQPWSSDMKSVTLTPASTGTDGFYFAVLTPQILTLVEVPPVRFVLLIVFIVVVMGGGFLIGTQFPADAWYEALAKPPFTPPDVAFMYVWPVLYLFIAIAGWSVFTNATGGGAWGLWLVNLILNFAYTPVFFGAHALGWSTLVVAATLATAVAFISATWSRNRLAGALFVPYALWLGYAFTLDLSIWYLN